MQYGEIEEMNVCDNLGDHLVGNVYIKVNISLLLKQSTDIHNLFFNPSVSQRGRC